MPVSKGSNETGVSNNARIAQELNTPSPNTTSTPPRAISRPHRCRVCGEGLSPVGVCLYISEHRLDRAGRHQIQMDREGREPVAESEAKSEISLFVAARIPLQFHELRSFDRESTRSGETADELRNGSGGRVVQFSDDRDSPVASREQLQLPKVMDFDDGVKKVTTDNSTLINIPETNIVTTLLTVTPGEPKTMNRKDFNQPAISFGRLIALLNKDVINSPVIPLLAVRTGGDLPANVLQEIPSLHLPPASIESKADKAIEKVEVQIASKENMEKSVADVGHIDDEKFKGRLQRWPFSNLRVRIMKVRARKERRAAKKRLSNATRKEKLMAEKELSSAARNEQLKAEKVLTSAEDPKVNNKIESKGLTCGESGYRGSEDTVSFSKSDNGGEQERRGSSVRFLREIELRRRSSMPLLTGSVRQKVKCRVMGRTIVGTNNLDDHEGTKMC